MIKQLLPMVLNQANLEQVNSSVRKDLEAFELLEGELPPFLTISPGEKELNLSVITLKEIADPENEGKKNTVFSRTLKRQSFTEFIEKLLMGEKNHK